MCSKQLLVLAFTVIIKYIAAQIDEVERDVGDECLTKHGILDGVCKKLSECEEAVRAIRQNKNLDDFPRCGFAGTEEIICCPRLTGRFGLPRIQNNNYKSERKSERECKKIIENTKPPPGLHIINGEAAMPGEFPHMVAIGYNNNAKGYLFNCGGALISNTYVLTAAHCVNFSEWVRFQSVPPEIIRAGEVLVDDNTPWNEETDYRIAQIIAHPRYTPSTKYHDIALLRLEKPVKVSENLHATCLYTSDSDPFTALTITGWGQTSQNRDIKSNILLKADVNIVSSELCAPMYRSWLKLPHNITQDQLCAGDPRGNKDTCQGDSGGPLQISESGEQYIYRIVGVTSFGAFCGGPASVYTRVSRYIDWIESIVWPN